MFIGSVLLYSLFTLLHNDTDYYNLYEAFCQELFQFFVKFLFIKVSLRRVFRTFLKKAPQKPLARGKALFSFVPLSAVYDNCLGAFSTLSEE